MVIITMRSTRTIIVALPLAIAIIAGPNAYSICQAGCSAVLAACYSAAGARVGTVYGSAVPVPIADCNAAFWACNAMCAAITLSSTA